jgi:aquaporin Z
MRVAESGASFFRSLVQHLVEALGVAYAFASELRSDRRSFRTLAVWGRGEFLPNVEVPLLRTPCETRISRRHPSGVMQPAATSLLSPSRRDATGRATPLTWRAALRQHWPEYLMEAGELGLFMMSACIVVALLHHPSSPLSPVIIDATARRVLTGAAMGLTAIAIVYSPWGKQSGGHFNPSVTFTFWRLGRIAGWDAGFYIAAQFVGAVIGVLIASVLLGETIAHPSVRYVATQPGAAGERLAFLAEALLSFGIMTLVLTMSSNTRWARYTGCACGLVVATYIAIEAPISGMSMNPARSFGPAFVGQIWNALWIYFTAPPLGMLLAAEVYVRLRGAAMVACPKLHHQNAKRCLFCLHQSRVKNGAAS